MVSRHQHASPFRIGTLKVLISFGKDFQVEASAILGEGVQKQKEHDFIRPVKVFDRLFLVSGSVNKKRYCRPGQQQRSLKTIAPRHDLHRQSEATFSRTNETSHGCLAY